MYKYIFRNVLHFVNWWQQRMSSGSSFHTVGHAYQKNLDPYFFLKRGTTKKSLDDDLKHLVGL